MKEKVISILLAICVGVVIVISFLLGLIHNEMYVEYRWLIYVSICSFAIITPLLSVYWRKRK